MATLPLLPLSESNGGVVVASSDMVLREQLISTLHSSASPVLAASGGADALDKLESSECDVLLVDHKLPDLDCDELVRIVEAQYPGVQVLRIDGKTRCVIGAPRRWTSGVSEVFRLLERLSGVSSDLVAVQQTPALTKQTSSAPLPRMIGQAPPMQELYRMVRLVAPRDTAVLVTGPTGSGKELVARAVHDLSRRAERPFVVINCSAIPEALLEAELFGYTRGAFTGAVQSRPGRIQGAQGGTLFL
ncbi:MAG: sigma-54-dependent transcriptional regulator, partial [Terriglobales bacterium]